jgi:hypothetical protein
MDFSLPDFDPRAGRAGAGPGALRLKAGKYLRPPLPEGGYRAKSGAA